ncbi:conserved Plasmodium protein, unknown function [Plasmodium relictum]|uniref:Uncharacterized protein n=1 Tax=Plasmodium relictum TaxID=85471 RepID=A0A1J1H2Q4_PLARL|nr:conserved Plasmodium protein, unknown function [Plasmodium relictum]CRG99047.1 conserved Plasmodium protein, unknown function [Plasmodium relictum]
MRINVEKENEENGNMNVTKNIIYNNFQNRGFLNNFNFLHENIRNLNKSLEYNCDILNKKLEYGKFLEKNNYNKEKNKKKFIIHLMPSENSQFYIFLNKKKEEVLKKYGKDETYKYDIHISLTGYFFCDNVNVFLNTLYIYMFYYVKLYNIFKNLSFNHLFFNISCNSNYSNIYIKKNKSGDKEKKIIFEKKEIEEKIDKKKKNILNMENNSNKSDSHVLITNDGYVIIPIFCEWIKKIFENFSFLIRNSSFISHNKYKNVNKLENNYISRNSVISKNLKKRHKNDSKLFLGNSLIKSKYQKDTTYPNSIYSNNIILSDIKNNENSSSSFINFEDKQTEEKANNSNVIFYDDNNSNNSNSNSNGNVFNKLAHNCNINEKDNTDNYNINYNKCHIESKNSNYKKIKRLKKCSKNNNNNDKKEEKNKIKYKYNNTEVKLSEFRIKECNHISLASNRNNKEIQKDIACMYKDLKYYFSNCSWDMVMFECDENLFPQEKVKNNFLNEIFRFKKFAVS